MEAAANPATTPTEAVVALPTRTHESVGSVAGALWRRKFWIAIPTLFALLASLATVNFLTPRYTGEARVLLENRETVYSRPDRDTGAGSTSIDPEAVASQVQNVMSKDLALKIIREMELHKRAEYDPVQKGLGLSGQILVMLGLQKDPRTIPQEERVLEMYYKRLLVYPLGKSRVMAIEFQSEDPKVAADVANRIAEEYLQREEGAKNQTSRVTSEWLDKAIAPLMKKVQDAEAKVEAFRASKGLFVSSNNTTISTQQLSELNTQFSLVRSQQADLQARAKIIREALRLGRIFETSEVINNELVRRLLEQRAQLKAQIAFEERTLLPGHPRMKELASQLADLEQQVRAAAERAARALENDARAAGARVASMQAEINSQKKTTALSNEDEVHLKALERDAVALREQLNSYRNKFLDAAARSTESAQPADARIISRAFPQSEPTFPKKVPIVLLATLGTLVVAATLIATQSLMARAGSPDYGYAPAWEPAPVNGMPVQAAAEIPAGPLPWEKPARGWGGFSLPFGLGAKKAAPMQEAVFSPSPLVPMPDVASVRPGAAREAQTSEQVESLAREIALMDFSGSGKVILFHALTPEARAGLSTLRFARRLAQDGAAIVVDVAGQGFGARNGNLYARVLGRIDGIGSAGLAAWLDKVAPLGDIIHRDPRTRLHVIPAGDALQNRIASTPLRNEVATLVSALRRSYSHVVIDAGTVGGAGEFFAGMADAVVLIAADSREDEFLERTVARFEALRDAPVYVMAEETGAEFAPANDPLPQGGYRSL